jgi:RNA polymerase sigma-70 factor (ECF subfamily)
VTIPLLNGQNSMSEVMNEPGVRTSVPQEGRLRDVEPEFAAIYEANSRVIYYLCLRLLGDPAQAEDATHDVFLKAWRHHREFEGRAAWRTWLYRIAINHCSNLRQSWNARNVVCVEDDVLFQGPSTDSVSPLRVIELRELGERIQQTLDRLPDEYRLILLLVTDEELSYEEVAVLTGQTAGAVRGKLHRARKLFASAFEKTR